MRLSLVRPLLLASLLVVGTSRVLAGTWNAFGPQTYTRGTGDPVTVINTFSVHNPNTQFTLHIVNGSLVDSGTELVSSSIITLNGVQVVGPNEFNQNVTVLDKAVTLLANNEIDVQVRGQPGGQITLTVIGVDNDPPTIKATVTPAPNAAGWNNSNPTVSFTCDDAISGVASCPAPVTVTTEGANQIISGTATDLAGNTATASVTINLDKTPPAVAITSPANGATLASTSATVTGTVSDALSGVASVTCAAGGATPVPATISAGNFTCNLTLVSGSNAITAKATDVAGNTATATVTVTVGGPQITSFTPQSAPAGTLVTITGSGFVSSTGAGPAVALNKQGGGTMAGPVASFTTASINFVIPTGAATGLITVTVAGQSASTITPLTVVPSSDFTLSVAPAGANLIPGQAVSYAVSLASTTAFNQLATLSVSGLPVGVTASFSPSQITAGQTALLTLAAPAGQAAGTATLAVSASATVDGIPLVRTAGVAATVQAVSTSFLGRTVVDDPLRTPLAG